MMKKWFRRLTVYDGLVLMFLAAPVVYAVVTEAPTGFNNTTNGFESQVAMDADRANFDSVEEFADGLGPVYNAQACRECHQNPVSGATSQVTELRVARTTTDGFGNIFYSDRPGGSLINDRAVDPSIQERVAGADNERTFRTSLNILGDGFVEALPDSSFTNTQAGQAASVRGTIIRVPVLEAAAGTTRIARFGWKNQHASLLSFAADAYLNEMGITSPLQPTENTSNGVAIPAVFDGKADPEDAAVSPIPPGGDPNLAFGTDVSAFTRFMRSTKAPSRDTVGAATSDAVAGASLFTSIGCAKCHVTQLQTAPPNTVVNGGKFTIPAALGDKIIHPYSDFMMHDVGTGDFIIQNGGVGTFSQMRTPPLWGLRTRTRMMHDGESLTRNDAILRHFGQANPTINNYINLSLTQQNQLIAFLNTL